MSTTTDIKTDTNIFDKVKKASWSITLVLIFIVAMQTCSTSKKISALNTQVDSLVANQATPYVIEKQIKLEGLRISKRMLYDNNAIIRTAVRPDDRMNQYDEEIKKIEKN